MRQSFITVQVKQQLATHILTHIYPYSHSRSLSLTHTHTHSHTRTHTKHLQLSFAERPRDFSRVIYRVVEKAEDCQHTKTETWVSFWISGNTNSVYVYILLPFWERVLFSPAFVYLSLSSRKRSASRLYAVLAYRLPFTWPHECACVCIKKDLYIRLPVYIECGCVRLRVCLCACMYVYVYAHACRCICVCICICMYLYMYPPKMREIALWSSTNGAIAHFLVLPGSLLSITEITEYKYFSPSIRE